MKRILQLILLMSSVLGLLMFTHCQGKKSNTSNVDSTKHLIKKQKSERVANQSEIRILFDAKKGETAGNADWVVDADEFNLNYRTGGTISTKGKGNEANAQQNPTPSWNEVKKDTDENFWTGAISAWGIDCAKLGFEVESLPYNGKITYGDIENPEDLSNYKVYVICEANLRFTKAEKQAIIKFVENGGGLFLIADHDKSDRNRDDWDSPKIYNDIFSENGLKENPFGVTFDYTNISDATTNIAKLKGNEILEGKFGKVRKMAFHNGCTMTINKSKNPTAKGLIFRKNSDSEKIGIMAACCTYGNGKVVFLGDSSCADDGTGDFNDKLYNGYTGDTKGNHREFIMNATLWLTK